MNYYPNALINNRVATVGLFLINHRQELLKSLSIVDYVDLENTKIIRFSGGCIGEPIYGNLELEKRVIKSGVINPNFKVFEPDYYTGNFLVPYYIVYKQYLQTLEKENQIGYEYLVEHPHLITLTKMVIGKSDKMYVLESIRQFR